MNLYPIESVLERAEGVLQSGGSFYQQFLCASCGAKQTMEEANKMYAFGTCEECGSLTDIRANGCNLMAIFRREETHEVVRKV